MAAKNAGVGVEAIEGNTDGGDPNFQYAVHDMDETDQGDGIQDGDGEDDGDDTKPYSSVDHQDANADKPKPHQNLK